MERARGFFSQIPASPCPQHPSTRGPKKEWQVGQDNDSRSRRPRTAAPGLARVERRAELGRGGGRRAALDGQHPGGAALLLPPGPAASQQDFDCNQPLIRKRLHPLRNGQKKLRSLQGGTGLLPTWSTSGDHLARQAQRAERGLQAQKRR